MSIEVMSLVWKNFRRGGSEKLALLALADWCDDKGERLYPSISAIAEKINVSECQARRIVHKFIDEGILRVISNEHGGAPGSTRHYALNISALVNSTRETASTHATPSIDATPSAHATPEQGRRVASMRETASTHATLSVNPLCRLSARRRTTRHSTQRLSSFLTGLTPTCGNAGARTRSAAGNP